MWREGGTQGFVLASLDIIHLVTKPVVDPDFLQDWLRFLSQEQQLGVHLLFSDDAFADQADRNLYDRFPGVKLYRIEKVSKHGSLDQASVFLADYLDLLYLAGSIHPVLVHSHDTRSLFLSRYFFPNSTRLHSWWLEDRSAHRLWRVLVERLADFRTWETVDTEGGALGTSLTGITGQQIPLPTPQTFSGDYERGTAFDTVRELYRSILRDVELKPL